MRARYPFFGLLMLLCGSRVIHGKSTDETASALLPLEARNVDISGEDDVTSNSYVLPNQIFNDGKPYYARQDPVSGQLDFSAKKPAGIEPEVNEVLNSKEKIVLNGGSSPNIHDFLNLPVKYSSSKFVYPLVSSSYANLKYQGSNKNYVTNKKPTSVVAPVTVVPPRYSHSENYFPVTTTKLTAVTPTEPGYFTPSSTSTSTRASTPSPTTRTTTRTTPSTTDSTTPSTTTVRYTTTTRRTVGEFTDFASTELPNVRRPAATVASTTHLPPPRLITTRKKFVPLRKTTSNPTTTTTTTTTSSVPSSTTSAKLPATRPTLSSHEAKFTTHHPTPPAAIFPTDPATTTKMYTSSTSHPVVFTSTTTTTTTMTPTVDGTKLPQLDPADVYHTLEQKKKVVQQQEQELEQEQQVVQPLTKPTMTLSDIFNSLAEEEVAVANNYQQNQGFDAQGNLIEPIAPSQPSPFAMQPQYPLRPNPGQNQLHPPAGLNDASLESYGNEYVSYQVQQPNMMQYRPMPGQINNVVISPGQQSASFVLGSQQQVGHSNNFGHVEKEALFPPKETTGGQVQYGQVINEDIGNIKRPQPTPPSSQQQMPHLQVNNKFQADGPPNGVASYPEPPPEAPTPYQQLPLIGSNLRPTKKKQPTKVLDTISSASASNSVAGPTLNQPQDTKELLVSTNIRFPANDEESVEQSSPGVLPGPPAGPPSGPHINGHAQPLSLQQIQHANPVVFPKLNDEESVQIQQHEVLNINQQHHKQQLTFPAQTPPQGNQEQAGPSQDMQPPPRYATPQQQQHQQQQQQQHQPQFQSNPGKRPQFYKEFDRKSQSAQSAQSQSGPRPNPNLNLPNILPQFRPNAKISNGHNPHVKQEPGNIRLPQQHQGVNKMPYNPSTAPQFAHRRQPLQQQQIQKRYPMNRISEYGPTNAALDVNRRIYRPHPPGGVQRMAPQLRDRLYARRPNLPSLPNLSNSPPLRAVDGYPAERHAPIAEAYKMNPGDLDDLEEEDLVISDPPQAPNKERQTPSESNLEAVVTLQMLQSQKKPLNADDTGAGEIQVTADNDAQEDIYAGYTKEEANPSEIRETTEYQNTPFSVIRDQPQEPILKNKKPQSLQQQQSLQNKGQQLPKPKFPYAIEKPDPSYTELHQGLSQGTVPGVLIAPRIINSAFSSGTETPIAIAYTPTEPNPPKHSQTEQVLNNNDFDLRGHNYEKDFMAPFYPSASLGAAPSLGTATPSNWKIVSAAAPDASIYEKNSINRADVETSSLEEQKTLVEANNSTTEKSFELDSFQPQLQGGFKPIYPPNYRQVEDKAEAEPEESVEQQKKPLALALTGAQILSTGVITSSSSSSSSSSSILTQTIPSSTTTTTTTTTSPATTGETTTTITSKAPQVKASNPPKKSSFETSLAALLFGEDDEFENEARKSESQSQSPTETVTVKTPSGPRNVARMGPRSLRS